MDKEDRAFLKVVGDRAARVLKTRNVRLWSVFRQRCEENGEKPERVLGRTLLKFARSIVDGDEEFAEEMMGKTIKLSAITKKEKLIEKLDEIVKVKEKLSKTQTDELDELVKQLITAEIRRATASPLDMIQQQKPQEPIVIDANLLSMMPPEQLDALAELARAVKEEKMKAMQMTSEELVEGGEENAEEEELAEDDSDVDRVVEGSEGSSESS